MQQEKDVIIADTLNDLDTAPFSDYLGHSLCLDGECRIRFNGAKHVMRKGDLMRGDVVCRQAMRDIEISFGGVEECERLCRQLLDKPLHRTRHLTLAARQVALVCADKRYVRLLLASLFQSLRTAQLWCKSNGIQRVKALLFQIF